MRAKLMGQTRSQRRAFQLPIMVRKPKMVWPGLDKEGLHLKSIAGDGNCLFASLSDQLYGTPTRHGEIRATIIEHMRAFRPLYEDFVHAEDVIQKRATRATTDLIRKQMEEDAFEGYLGAMSRLGTYGGQPELLAFVRAYNQDVMVHLPPTMGWETSTLPYKNEHRPIDAEARAALHICYGGDEEKHAHYDSSQKTDGDMHTLPSRPKSQARQGLETSQLSADLTPRALRHLKADPTRDMMHEMVTNGSRDIRSSFDLDRRARSPSVASSHYSTSSKRSYEEEGEHNRSSKRTDRKKRSLRSRTAIRQLSGSPNLNVLFTTSQPTSSGPPTPTSSQDSDSSDQAETGQQGRLDRHASSPPEVIDLDGEDSDYRDSSTRPGRRKALLRSRQPTPLDREVLPSIPSIVTEASRSAIST